MAPKHTVRAVMGSVVRTRRTLVQETVEVSVVQKTTPKEKKVVEVEVRDMEAEPPAPPPEVAPTAVEGEREVAAAPHPPLPAAEELQTPVGEEKDESEKETQPPLESEEERKGGMESPAGGDGFKGEIEPEPAAEDEDKKARAEGGKIEEVKKGEVEKQRRRRRRRTKAAGGGGSAGPGRSRGYKRYVFRVLKQVHPELRVSSMAMTVLDSLVKDMFERLAEEAARLSKYSGKATLSSREIQGAVRLVLPGELGKHAVAEGSKAVANYMAAETSRR